MEVDEALAKLGAVGKWQILYYTMISTATMVPTCFHMLAINYIGKRTCCTLRILVEMSIYRKMS